MPKPTEVPRTVEACIAYVAYLAKEAPEWSSYRGPGNSIRLRRGPHGLYECCPVNGIVLDLTGMYFTDGNWGTAVNIAGIPPVAADPLVTAADYEGTPYRKELEEACKREPPAV